jgi:hypothetical protein
MGKGLSWNNTQWHVDTARVCLSADKGEDLQANDTHAKLPWQAAMGPEIVRKLDSSSEG